MNILIEKTLPKTLPSIFRPLIRLCLKYSVRLSAVIEVIKEVYIEVAKEELGKKGDEISLSRISLMTGVHRPDVTRFVRRTGNGKRPAHVITNVIGSWQKNKKFTTSNGQPRILTTEGRESEFAELVKSVSTAVNSYTVLYELERIGAIEKTPRGVRLISKMYLPRGDAEQGFRMLAEDVSDLVSSVEHNISREPKFPLHHIKTEYDNIPEDMVPTIREWIFKEGAHFHERLRKYLSQFDLDLLNEKALPRGKRYRVAVGSFEMTEPWEENLEVGKEK